MMTDKHTSPIYIDQARSALILVDIQNDFMPTGALPVANGDAIIPVVNALAARFNNVILTQDWHPPEHISFAANHVDKNPYELIDLPYGKQVLWTTHCVQGTHGAAFHHDLHAPHAQLIIRKGYHRSIDSYSAFMEADKRTRTGLAAYLSERGIDTVYIAGLATDFCVAWTALDARTANLATHVIDDACRAIDLDGSLAKAWQDMTAAGVMRIDSHVILASECSAD